MGKLTHSVRLDKVKMIGKDGMQAQTLSSIKAPDSLQGFQS